MLDEDVKMFWFLRYERLRKQWLAGPYSAQLARDYAEAQAQYYLYQEKCAAAFSATYRAARAAN